MSTSQSAHDVHFSGVPTARQQLRPALTSPTLPECGHFTNCMQKVQYHHTDSDLSAASNCMSRVFHHFTSSWALLTWIACVEADRHMGCLPLCTIATCCPPFTYPRVFSSAMALQTQAQCYHQARSGLSDALAGVSGDCDRYKITLSVLSSEQRICQAWCPKTVSKAQLQPVRHLHRVIVLMTTTMLYSCAS